MSRIAILQMEKKRLNGWYWNDRKINFWLLVSMRWIVNDIIAQMLLSLGKTVL